MAQESLRKKAASSTSVAATDRLKALGLKALNPGVFDGEWSGSRKSPPKLFAE